MVSRRGFLLGGVSVLLLGGVAACGGDGDGGGGSSAAGTGVSPTPPSEVSAPDGGSGVPRSPDRRGEQLVPGSATPERGFVVGDTSGLKDGAETVHIYFDPACPDCKDYELAHGEELASRVASGDVKLVLVPVPFLGGRTIDDYSARASSALVTIAERNPVAALKFFELMFSRSRFPGVGDSHVDTPTRMLADWALLSGAGVEVAKLVEGNHYVDWVNGTKDFVVRDKVLFPSGSVGTPTVVRNGRFSGRSGLLVPNSGYVIEDLR